MSIRAVDLFAGIGGFHAVGEALGLETIYACDVDPQCRSVYQKNWSLDPAGDIQSEVNDNKIMVPRHDILFAGFPCQPFSKSGSQRGMEEARGTLFFNIAKVLEARRPRLVVLENVRNLWSSRHQGDWETIIAILRSLNYRVADTPLVTSPHRIPPELGGTPQIRERVYINATYVPPSLQGQFGLVADSITREEAGQTWNPQEWSLQRFLPSLQGSAANELELDQREIEWLDVWEDFLNLFTRRAKKLPGFPLWFDVWTGQLEIESEMPEWKQRFIQQNINFYNENKFEIDSWKDAHRNLENFPTSRRKFEWQAGDLDSIWMGLIQFRPSGIRVKPANYIPAAVAMNQTSIYGPKKRRISVGELARLQGFPDWFSFEDQKASSSYKQLGNGIAIASAYHSVRAHIRRDEHLLSSQRRRDIVELEIRAPDSPFTNLEKSPQDR